MQMVASRQYRRTNPWANEYEVGHSDPPYDVWMPFRIGAETAVAGRVIRIELRTPDAEWNIENQCERRVGNPTRYCPMPQVS